MLSLSIPYFSQPIQLIKETHQMDGLIWFHQGGGESSNKEWFSAWPESTYEYLGNGSTRVTNYQGDVEYCNGDFFNLLKNRYPLHTAGDLKTGNLEATASPFEQGVLAGHLNYDLGLELLNISSRHLSIDETSNNDTSNQKPLAVVGDYRWVCEFDHVQKKACLYIAVNCPAAITHKVKQLAEQLNQPADTDSPDDPNAQTAAHWQSAMSFEHYQYAFDTIQNYCSFWNRLLAV